MDDQFWGQICRQNNPIEFEGEGLQYFNNFSKYHVSGDSSIDVSVVIGYLIGFVFDGRYFM